ncbi:DUF2971 domain-containing protein [Nisaea sp.]|uniref:DUF2971 domain-containing protein n=1 Tax=Nisaea sp. TaxID=2024842 RepID=UPI0032969688
MEKILNNRPPFENAIFRYRSTKALLGEFKELENQSIYFSPPQDLNDPMEGLRQVYWHGDKITWRNLIRHYVICLCYQYQSYLIARDVVSLERQGIFVHCDLDKLPKPQARKLYDECLSAVEKLGTFTALHEYLSEADREIGHSELLYLLNFVHLLWLSAVQQVFFQFELVPEKPTQDPDPKPIADALRALAKVNRQLRKDHPGESLDKFTEAQSQTQEQMWLIIKANSNVPEHPNRSALLSEYPQQYLRDVMQLVFPQWYVACFSLRHDNAAMWGYYADGHNGCCLVFKPTIKNGNHLIRMKGRNDYGPIGSFHSFQEFPLEEVRYSSETPNLEFFRNISQYNQSDLKRIWFQSSEGQTSDLAKHLNMENFQAWRKGYWENYRISLLRKLTDWKHEEESRVILTDSMLQHGEDSNRVYSYDFNDLEGIIFGTKVTQSDKLKIIYTVGSKMEEQQRVQPFKFFQAKHNQRNGKMDAVHMDLLRFELEQPHLSGPT